MAKLILGITGEMGCGKGTIARHVTENYHGSAHRFSTILRDILDRIHVEQSRHNMTSLSRILRENYGEDVFARSMHHDVENDRHDIVVVDGIRRLEDIKHLRQVPHFKLVYVEADMRVRFERILLRGENVGETKRTFADFQKDHELNSELQIRGLKDCADYVVDNNGEVEGLYRQIDQIIEQNI